MKTDILFVDAICKSEENNLLGHERLMRMLDGTSTDEGLRVLREAGFGGDTVVSHSYEFENLIAFEQRALFDFLREYLGDKHTLLSYAAVDNDFHNAEAVLRSKYVRMTSDKLFAVEGTVAIETLKNCVDTGDYSCLPVNIAIAMRQAQQLFEDGDATGYAVSNIFAKKLFDAKLTYSKISKRLHSATVFNIDAVNVSVCFRSDSIEKAKEMFLSGGKLTLEDLAVICSKDAVAIKNRFANTEYTDILELCLAHTDDGLPLVEFENVVNGNTLKIFKNQRFTTVEGLDPVILYYLYKQNEIYNVRTVMVGLSVGMDKSEIKQRLRENYAG